MNTGFLYQKKHAHIGFSRNQIYHIISNDICDVVGISRESMVKFTFSEKATKIDKIP